MHFPKPTRCNSTTDEIVMYGSDDLHCTVLFDADPSVLAVSIQRESCVTDVY